MGAGDTDRAKSEGEEASDGDRELGGGDQCGRSMSDYPGDGGERLDGREAEGIEHLQREAEVGAPSLILIPVFWHAAGNRRFWGLNGPLLPQDPPEKVGGEAPHLFQWVLR